MRAVRGNGEAPQSDTTCRALKPRAVAGAGQNCACSRNANTDTGPRSRLKAGFVTNW
jgi:hypothetical protein